MSVLETEFIDFIAVEGDGAEVVLTISDHLDWSEPIEHLVQLQAKLNAYLAFIETGQIEEDYPAAVGKPRKIRVLFKHEPSRSARAKIVDAAATIEGAGFRFEWATLDTFSKRSRDLNPGSR